MVERIVFLVLALGGHVELAQFGEINASIVGSRI